ncbi:hypothetical protein GJ496_007971 [Pomphorhynchus laevis]|nr:hypothetical protein GJ496_007971 [Pomphorhynchus laevis]
MSAVLENGDSDKYVGTVLQLINLDDYVTTHSTDDKRLAFKVTSLRGQVYSTTDSLSVCKWLLNHYRPNLFDLNNWARCLQINGIIELCMRKLRSKSTWHFFDALLQNTNFLVGYEESFADVIFWLNSKDVKLDSLIENQSLCCLTRHLNVMDSLLKKIDIKSSNVVAMDKSNIEQTIADGYKSESKFVDLPGAEVGNLVVRFPPEASGYLHIGHVKAALLNQFYKEAFEGKLILRYDDTNPAKESLEYEQSIEDDVKRIGLAIDQVTHTSDHFDFIQKCCEQLIRKGLAYCDDTEASLIKTEREAKICSKHRDQTPSEAMNHWNAMKAGSTEGQKFCVRAKIDMQSNVGCMRDPTIYRCKNEAHVRCSFKYKVYPTYDFACPIVDSVEGITHALRTTEYHDRDQQYYWFIDALELRKPYIYEFGRLNLQNTVLSKRKLQYFVQNKIVDGWDDPRMPTLRGLFRRGLTLEGLRSFIATQGSSRTVINMGWDKLWAINSKYVDMKAVRYNALMARYTVKVTVLNAKEEMITVAKHPKDPNLDDVVDFKSGDLVTLMNWGNAIVNEIVLNRSKQIEKIIMSANFDNNDFKKTKKISWIAEPINNNDCTPILALVYGDLISKAKVEPNDDISQLCQHKSKYEFLLIGEPTLKEIRKGQVIQIQRRGFFICDQPFEPLCYNTFVKSPLVLISIPEGSQKKSPTSLKSMSNRLNKNRRQYLPSSIKSSCTFAFDDHTFSCLIEDEPTIYSSNSFKPPLTADLLNDQIVLQGNTVRDLKSSKAPKEQIKSEVEKLLDLKSQYRILTGKDWTPTKPESDKVSSSNQESPLTADSLNDQIVLQGNTVRDLKSSKAPKEQIKSEVEKLLDLKSQYRTLTGKNWTPTKPESDKVSSSNQEPPLTADSLNDQIVLQGNTVRDLKSSKAPKEQIKSEVEKLLDLKSQYRILTGKDWTPTKPKSDKVSSINQKPPLTADSLNDQIVFQGNTVRDLKSSKAPKEQIKSEVEKLLDLKSQYRTLTGKDWTPTKPQADKVSSSNQETPLTADSLNDQIVLQGNTVRDLKSNKAPKEQIKSEVEKLLDLKSQYRTLTGKDWTPTKPESDKVSSSNQEPPLTTDSLNDQIVLQGNTVRNLKSSKAPKEQIKSEVEKLLDLKSQYRTLTGKDWMPIKPKADKVSSSNQEPPLTADSLNDQIVLQGNTVRDLKSSKAPKEQIKSEVEKLLDFKSQYRTLTGKDWTPTKPESDKVSSSNQEPPLTADSLNDQIVLQGNTVRDLKSSKAPKEHIKSEVEKLLDLKSQYRTLTGKDWTPTKPESDKVSSSNQEPPLTADSLNDQIVLQGNTVRDLKSSKAPKEQIKSEVEKLLDFKSQYRTLTGKDWTPTKPESDKVSSSNQEPPLTADSLNDQIVLQGNTVRDLKSSKAPKEHIKSEVEKLLDLKSQFRTLTGKDWTPTKRQADKVSSSNQEPPLTADSLNDQIVFQGNTVRDLKSSKAPKEQIKSEVEKLLDLKRQYRTLIGKDWTPTKPEADKVFETVDTLSLAISSQLFIVQQCISNQAEKEQIKLECEKLSNLKRRYRTLSKNEWFPTISIDQSNQPCFELLNSAISLQFKIVDVLTTESFDEDPVQCEIALLSALKSKYRAATGADWKPSNDHRLIDRNSSFCSKSIINSMKGDCNLYRNVKKNINVNEKIKVVSTSNGNDKKSKKTRLGLEAKKEDDFSSWYLQVITKANLIEYYDVSGCYILRPGSYFVWEQIQRFLDDKIKSIGVQNAYFPLFVSEDALKREQSHIKDFAPEVAWVTKSGDKDMNEPIAVRPTSETVMYPAYANWVQSHRDLPIRLNQWSNVVRWEFKHPTPFLRTREFLWQEGHSAFAEADEAIEETYQILEFYEQVYNQLLAVPVIKGRKSEKEKFAGAEWSLTTEAYIRGSGRGIQGATSHHLGQNFSKMFDISFEDPQSGKRVFAFQNSWGLTTRTIGVMIMIHSDNIGLVLPPRVAMYQVVIIPCGINASCSEEDANRLYSTCKSLELQLKQISIRVYGDYRSNITPGWKFSDWELKGVPIRIELGFKDLSKGSAVVVHRYNGFKESVPISKLAEEIPIMLSKIHDAMLQKSTNELNDNIVESDKWNDFLVALESGKIILSPFCGEEDCEQKIKDTSSKSVAVEEGAPSMGAKTLCIPLNQPRSIHTDTKCIRPDCMSRPLSYCLFGRSY